ncbi:MAG TPA: ferritin family protein [Thermoanaerobaculia bacterium]|nr:ferritin family protein [Thermoanaerobaculia bacterium]
MTKQLDLTKLDLMDALDLAILIEQEAMERYEELTAVMREHRTEEAASFFHFMAKAEAKHGADLLTQRTKLFGKTVRRVDRSLLWDVEAPGYETVHDFMTLREALKVALDAEVKAYDFFDKALKLPLSPPVKKLFEELLQEEIAHQEMVKKEFAKAPPEEEAKPEDFADEPVAQ